MSTPLSDRSPLARTEVVLVSYRSRSHVEELIAGWPSDLSIVVVDNAGNVDGLAELSAAHSNVRYVDGGGQGFGRAANLGAFSSTKDFLVFVNPDCRPTATHLEALVVGVASDDSAASHAATMTGHDGSIEAGVGGWEPSLRRLTVHALGLGWVFRKAGLFAFPTPGEHSAVDWTTGACLATRADRFRELGGFDESFYVMPRTSASAAAPGWPASGRCCGRTSWCGTGRAVRAPHRWRCCGCAGRPSPAI